MTDERTWLPSEWLDEVNPEPLAKPDNFIQPDGKGGWRLGYPDGHEDAEMNTLPLTDGDAVDMSRLETFGKFHVIVGDGGKPIPPVDYPVGASHHALYDDDWFFGDSLDDLFAQLAESTYPLKPGATVEVLAYTWSHQMHRFEAAPTPRLVPLEKA